MTAATQPGTPARARSSEARRSTVPWRLRHELVVIIAILVGLAVMLTLSSLLAFQTFGIWDFVTGTVWDPVAGIYGALPYIVGTLLSAPLALLFATPIALLTAIYPCRARARGGWRCPLTFLIELIAAIPSVVIGLWGVFILTPFLKATVESFLTSTLGTTIPLFEGPPLGVGLFAAGVILAIMILPTIVAVSREVITQRADGATRGDVRAGRDPLGGRDQGGAARRAVGHRGRHHPRARPGAG